MFQSIHANSQQRRGNRVFTSHFCHTWITLRLFDHERSLPADHPAGRIGHFDRQPV